MELDAISSLQVLELGQDAIGVVNVTANQVFEPFVAVESAAPLTDLRQPRPDLIGWRADRDGLSIRPFGSGYQVIAGQRPVNLVVGRAPLGAPGPR